MNKNINMSGFQADFAFSMDNITQNNSQIQNDFHTKSVEVHNKNIYIDGDNYRHEVAIGTGLTGFCEMNFEDIFPKVKKEIDFHRLPKKETARPNTPAELFDYLVELAEDTKEIIYPITQLHPYLECFSPIFLDDDKKGFDHFFAQMFWLKVQFGKLLRRCFDLNFYPDELSELTATQRFYLYVADEESAMPAPLKQILLFDGKILRDYNPPKGTPYSDYEAFAEIKPGLVQFVKNSNADLSIGYECSTVYDALCLEFYKMLELNIMVKQCKNCGKYFVVKGKYDNDYCSRIPNGGTQTCQKIGAMANFKDKVSDNKPYQLFQQYYKRYHARMKVGTIKEPDFKSWNLKACTMRDECIDGKCDYDAFMAWLEGSFPNRKKVK